MNRDDIAQHQILRFAKGYVGRVGWRSHDRPRLCEMGNTYSGVAKRPQSYVYFIVPLGSLWRRIRTASWARFELYNPRF